MNKTSLIRASDLWQLLEQRQQLSPDQTFLIDALSGKKITYTETMLSAEIMAAWLFQQGIGKGAVVAWKIPTSIEAVVLMLALSRLGAIQAPVIDQYGQRELLDIIKQAQPRHLIVTAMAGPRDYLAEANEAVLSLVADRLKPNILVLKPGIPPGVISLPAFEPDNTVAWYYFTSGTTAKPKGARHTDQSLMAAGYFLGNVLDISDDDVGSIGYPIAHIGGIVYCAMALMVGMPVVLLSRYTPDLVVASFNQYGVTLGGGSTAHYQLLLAEQRKVPNKKLIPSLRVLSGGGAAKPAALFHQVKNELGIKIVHAYGMTEAPISCSNSPYGSDEQLSNTDGLLMPSLEIKIVDNAGQQLNVGKNGEILLRGPNLCQGYLGKEQTKMAFDDDGFYHSGDIGMLREDGHICVTGRLKDIIIRKGENISAREIEDLLATHPYVKDVAVIGLPDEQRGEMVCAVIELVDDAAPLFFNEMKNYLLKKQLMKQKIPERLEVVDNLPRNQALQKILKNELVKRFSITQ